MPMLVARKREQVLEALQAPENAPESDGEPLTFVSPRGAMASHGGLFFAAIIEEAAQTCPKRPFVFWVDCGEDPAQAMLAMRCGLTHLIINTDEIYGEKLRSIAITSDVSLRHDYPEAPVDLLHTPI